MEKSEVNRATATITLDFGRFQLPVKFYSLIETSKPKLRMVDAITLTPIHYKTFNSKGQKVDKENIIKAYEITKGEFLPLLDEEIKAIYPNEATLLLKTSKQAKKLLCESGKYYSLGLDKKATEIQKQLYKALAEALKDSVLWFRVYMRNKEHLLGVETDLLGNLVAKTYNYYNEVRDYRKVGVQASVSEQQIELVKNFLKNFEDEDCKIAMYRNEQNYRLSEAIKEKIENGYIAEKTQEQEQAIKSFEAIFGGAD